ncbi:uncharacterized protein LOC143229119 isoform X2 [Tachypleus tridentatus]
MVMDAQTFIVPNFKYDGQGPAAYWWVSRGPQQNALGIQLTDEKNSDAPLKRYNGKTVVISLPDDKTIYDYDWFGVWCEEFSIDFGHVRIPHDIRVPPSLHLLGVKPENKLNCEILQDSLGFELRWVMDGGDTVMQLVGRIGDGEYMAFGLSKDDSKTEMVNADVVVTWIDSDGQGHAEDYFLASKEQCVGTHGSCPDQKYPGAKNSVTLMNAATVNGYKMVTFRRPQAALDKEYDQNIYSDGPQAVLWAIGPINNRGEVSYHKLHTDGNMFIDFARAPKWNCPVPASDSQYSSTNGDVEAASKREGNQYASSSTEAEQRAWEIPSIVCPANRTFFAQIGPTGGKKGYQGITGQVGWGIAWYINGLIIPEITVQRGKTYTFYVEGGNDPENPARHHPLYITESPEGGFEYKTRSERRREKVFAGVKRSRSGPSPTAAGRLCEWKIPVSQEEPPESYSTYAEFQQSLKLDCAQGEPAVLKWTPNERTPDLVYYQCYTHRYLGWKIHVVDSCDETFQSAASTLKIYSSNNEQALQDINSKTSLTKLEKPLKTNALPLFEASDDLISSEINFTVNKNPDISHKQFLNHELYTPSYQLYTQERDISNKTEYNTSQKDRQSATHDLYSVPQRDTSSTGYNLQQSFHNKPYSLHGDEGSIDVTKNVSTKDAQYVYYIPVDQLNRDFRRVSVQESPLSTFSSRSSELQTGPFFLDHSKQISHQVNKNKKRQLGQNASIIKFEGGFRPILTSHSEDRFPDPTTPPPNDPRPFPLSEDDSIPFHGAFKPGEPDFSGFGVSKFGQAVAAQPNFHSRIELKPQQTEIFRKPVLQPPSVHLPSAEERNDAHLSGAAHFSQNQQQEQSNYSSEDDQEVTDGIVAASSQLNYMYAAQGTGGTHNHGKETSENISLKHSLNTTNQDDSKSQHGAYELSVNDEKDVSQLIDSDKFNSNPQSVGPSEDLSDKSYSGSYYQIADVYSGASSKVEEAQEDIADEESYDHDNNESDNHEVQISTKKSNETLTDGLYLYSNSYNSPSGQQSTAKYGQVETLQLRPSYFQSSEEEEKNGSDYNILSHVMDLITNPVINHDQLGSEDNTKSVVRRSIKLL